MNKIYINGKFLTTQLTGVQRVGRELSSRMVEALARVGVNCEVLKPPAWVIGRHRALWTTLWEQFVLPLRARNGLLVNLCNTAPLLRQRGQIVVLHDAAVFDMPANYSRAYARWSRLQMKCLSTGNSQLATVSVFSRTRLALALRRAESDFLLLREGCNHALVPDPSDGVIDRLNLRGIRYVLAVGSLQAGKNFHRLLQAMPEVDEEIVLVIAGGGDSVVFSSGVELHGDRYIQAGYVSDGELRSLFSHALCFVQASTYEGFGLPLIEAMALGTPVACSTAASLPEVCADAACFFDPQSPRDIARAINEVARSPILREQLVAAGTARAQHYDWDVSAVELADVLLETLRVTNTRSHP